MINKKNQILNSHKDMKKLSPEESINFIRLMLEELNMSAFVYHPKIGAASITNNFEQKLALIQHSQLETEYLKMRQKLVANEWLMTDSAQYSSENQIKSKKKVPKYIN